MTQTTDPVLLALRADRDAARERLTEVQESCGCLGGATCAECVDAAAVASRLAGDVQALTQPAPAPPGAWYNLPIAEWARQGDAAQTERC